MAIQLISLGQALAKVKTYPRRCVATMRKPKLSRNAKLLNCVSPGNALKLVRNCASHFVPGQFVDVQGTSKGRGFAGGMKRWNFGGLRTTHGASASHRSIGFDRLFCKIPDALWKNKKWLVIMVLTITTTKFEGCWQVYPEDGLVSRTRQHSGNAKEWVIITDVQSKGYPADLPLPAGLKSSASPQGASSRTRSRKPAEAPQDAPAEEAKE